MTRGSETYYYHFNGHGDTIGLTNNAGNIAQTYKYDIWGNLLESTGSIENPYTYGGQWGYIYDSESSLYFLKTRHYDSSIGRFTTRDRFAGFENDSDSQNRYVYCQNDPVGNVDPTGYYPWWFHGVKIIFFIGQTIALLRKTTWVSIGTRIYKIIMGVIATLETAKFLAIAAQFFLATIFIASAIAILYYVDFYYYEIRSLKKHAKYVCDFGRWHSGWYDHN